MIPNLAEQQQIVKDLLAEARQLGATAAEAAVSSDESLAVTVRLGELETVEQSRDQNLGITVYMGQRKGSSSRYSTWPRDTTKRWST